MSTHAHQSAAPAGTSHYGRLAIMVLLSFIAMYVLMYAMVNSAANVYANVNQFYMAGLMAIPMVIIELALMRAMYHNKRRNAVIVVASVVAMIAFWLFIRRQTAIGDGQFLRSMIPHHGGAILMCQQAPLRDPELRELCQNIIVSQQTEIDQMKTKLRDRRASATLADSTAVVAVVDAYHRALSAGDTLTALSLLADDVMVLESGEVETRDQYRAHHLPADIEFARAVPSQRGPLRIVLRDITAWTISSSTTRGTYRGRAIASRGTELMVLSKHQEGWKIRAIHWSSHAATGSP